MSITCSDHAIAQLDRSIAGTLRRLARWLTTSTTADKGRVLPKELEDAEDWLLDDLGLVEDTGRPRSPVGGTTKRRE